MLHLTKNLPRFKPQILSTVNPATTLYLKNLPHHLTNQQILSTLPKNTQIHRPKSIIYRPKLKINFRNCAGKFEFLKFIFENDVFYRNCRVEVERYSEGDSTKPDDRFIYCLVYKKVQEDFFDEGNLDLQVCKFFWFFFFRLIDLDSVFCNFSKILQINHHETPQRQKTNIIPALPKKTKLHPPIPPQSL